MKQLTVICNECSNELQISNTVKFVTCSECKTILNVVKAYNSVYTKKHKRNSERHSVSKEVRQALDVYIEIRILEKEWVKKRKPFMTNGKPPEFNMYGFTGLFVGALSGIWAIIAGVFGSLRMVSLGAFFCMVGFSIHQFFEGRERNYKEASLEFKNKRNILVKEYNSFGKDTLQKLEGIIGVVK